MDVCGSGDNSGRHSNMSFDWRQDLLSAADSVTDAMSSLVFEYNAGWLLFSDFLRSFTSNNKCNWKKKENKYNNDLTAENERSKIICLLINLILDSDEETGPMFNNPTTAVKTNGI